MELFDVPYDSIKAAVAYYKQHKPITPFEMAALVQRVGEAQAGKFRRIATHWLIEGEPAE